MASRARMDPGHYTGPVNRASRPRDLAAERGGFEPPVPVSRHAALAKRWFQPLTHLSVGPKARRDRSGRQPSLMELPVIRVLEGEACAAAGSSVHGLEVGRRRERIRRPRGRKACLQVYGEQHRATSGATWVCKREGLRGGDTARDGTTSRPATRHIRVPTSRPQPGWRAVCVGDRGSPLSSYRAPTVTNPPRPGRKPHSL